MERSEILGCNPDKSRIPFHSIRAALAQPMQYIAPLLLSSALGDKVMTLSIAEKISRKCSGRAVCHLFDQTSWSDRSEALVKVGLTQAPSCNLSEVSAEDAQSLLALALSKDLCYGIRRMSSDAGSELAASFLALFGAAARHYTNSQTPYHLKGSAWAFSNLTSGTVDTGVVVRSGKFLSGVLWLSDTD